LDFSYNLPENFKKRVFQYLRQLSNDAVAWAFNNCKYEYEDIGLAFYNGLRGDNWDKRALDFLIEGPSEDISLLKRNEKHLNDAISKALKPNESGFQIRNITFFDDNEELPETDFPNSNVERLNVDIKKANDVYKDIVRVAERLCLNAAYNGQSSEDSINDYVRDMLFSMGYHEVKDQTRHGISINGAESGEVDILLTKEGKEAAIYEGLKLDSVNSSYISMHIDKAIVNYNALGTATYLVAYVSVADFSAFWNRYTEYLLNYSFPILVKRNMEILTYSNAATRAANMILSRDDYDFPVYFIAINIRK
jgi:hypothetical protein